MSTSQAHHCATIIQERIAGFTPQIAIILGSGLGGLAADLKDAIHIPYQDLPGFPISKVVGHENQLSFGYLNSTPVVCLQGRGHFYEEASFDSMKTYVRTMKLIGCEILFATNAAGSLNPDIQTGQLVLINDHINFQGTNPLIGSNDDDFGTRFPPLDNAYDASLRDLLKSSAKEINITLQEGVYLAVTGPCYETAAEIKAFRLLGADAVGMSTVPEVIIARHCGLKVATISTITNMATGLNTEVHDHEQVVRVAKKAASDLSQLISHFCPKLKHA